MSYHNVKTVLLVSNEETKHPVNPIGRHLAELMHELGERGFLVLIANDAFLGKGGRGEVERGEGFVY